MFERVLVRGRWEEVEAPQRFLAVASRQRARLFCGAALQDNKKTSMNKKITTVKEPLHSQQKIPANPSVI